MPTTPSWVRQVQRDSTVTQDLLEIMIEKLCTHVHECHIPGPGPAPASAEGKSLAETCLDRIQMLTYVL